MAKRYFRGRKSAGIMLTKQSRGGSLRKPENGVTKRVNQVTSDDSQRSQLAQLSKSLKSRLTPSEGARPGRPSDPTWDQHGKLPMSRGTVEMLKVLASHLSADDRKVSPMQVAAHLLELQLRGYATNLSEPDDKASRCA